MVVDPVEALFHPEPQPVHLLFVAHADEVLGLHDGSQDRPSVEVAFLGLFQQGGPAVDTRNQPGGGEDVGPQCRPAVHVALREIRVFEEAAKPGVFGVIPLRPHPVLRQVGATGGAVAKAQVPIPDRLHLDLAAPILAVVGAEAVSVHVLAQLHEEMVVDEGIHIDVGRVAVGGVLEIRPVERAFELIDMSLQPGPLARRQFVRFRLHVEEMIVLHAAPETVLVLKDFGIALRLFMPGVERLDQSNLVGDGNLFKKSRLFPPPLVGLAVGFFFGRYVESLGISGEAARSRGQLQRRAGVDELDGARQIRDRPAGHAAPDMILLENVAAGDIRFGVVLRTQPGDVHARRIAGDFVFENIDAHVGVGREFLAGFVDEDFHEPGVRRPMAHLVAQLVGQDVPHEGLVRIGRIQHPLGLLGEAENGDALLFVIFSQRPEGEGVLGILPRGVAAHVHRGASVKIRRAGQGRAAAVGVDEAGRDDDPGVALRRKLLALRVDDDERQVGSEAGQVFAQQRQIHGHRRARPAGRGKASRPHQRGVGDAQRAGVEARDRRRLGPVEGEADRRARGRDLQRQILRVNTARGRERRGGRGLLGGPGRKEDGGRENGEEEHRPR